ncbi:FUSC family membrane protein [Flavobacterium sp. K5-23]|uniref:FUSC family protein n=1 Tax=Flavobacterium sp. K5-23 TaxID=2746225 RepID=UPI0020107F28|nr:FUSC family membrane protein [Flavobacterium sp. K5-23]UQD57392.1 FUSC family protein [Flavobacterium sp. K5-23]
MISKIQKFTESTHFTNALKVTIATVIPVLLFTFLGYFQIGFTIALGAFFTYPSDVPSNLKQKINGLLVSAFIVSATNLVLNIAYPFSGIFYPFLALLIFLLSMISVYGQRATMISFSALLSISLAFAHLNEGWEILHYSALLLAGGLFYIIISLLFYYIRPYRYVELQIAECIRLTSDYLELRADLWTNTADKKTIIEKQLSLQVQLNIIQENIREVLIGNQINSGSSIQNRKLLLVFISLVEILELALATSFDHDKLHQKFNNNPKVLTIYQNLAYNLAIPLKQLADSIENIQKYKSSHHLANDLNTLQTAIIDYETDLGITSDSESGYMLTTMLQYAEKQIEKIKIVERTFSSTISSVDFKGKDKDLEKFLTPLHYPLSAFTGNLSFSSSVFRHSLRITITILCGFIIGQFVPFQNVYWILLTIVVILKPGYGLTKQRSFERIFGTVIGGLIAFGLLVLINNIILVSVFAVLAMVLGLTFSQSNYKIGVIFVTINVIFIYGIQTPNIADVVQYRILDTLTGAALAFLANYFLWPSWELLNIPKYLEKAITANRNYIKEISIYYNKKGELPLAYRLARKQAFIEVGNLMASFQRMMQEPKSKQIKQTQVYKLTVLNHTLLSSAASLGTYIQSHKTTKASEAFNVVVDGVIKNLDDAISILKNRNIKPQENNHNTELQKRFTELKNIREKELKSGNPVDEEAFQLKMQEAQLVNEQLIWLTNLSRNIEKNTELMMKS